MKNLIFLSALLFITLPLFAQPTGPNPDIIPTPIGGVGLLVMALVYGSKKVNDNLKK